MNCRNHYAIILFLILLAAIAGKANAQDFTFRATQTAGVGLADVKIEIVDPAQTTGDSYRVTFEVDELGGYFYSVENVNTQTTVVNSQPVEAISPVFEGVQVSAYVPPSQLAEIIEVRHGGTVVEPPVHVFRPRDRQGRGGNNSTGDYTLISGGGGGFDAVAGFEANTLGNDYEIRFDGNPEFRNFMVYAFRSAGTISVPFSVWNIGRGTPDDTSDDRQILAIGVEDGGSHNVYDGGALPSDGGPGDMYDRIYVAEIASNALPDGDINSDGVVDYDDFLMDLRNSGSDVLSTIFFDRPYTGPQVLRRLSLVNLTADSSYIPPPGTVIRINTTKSPTDQDVFEFATPDFGLYTNMLSLNLGSVALNSEFSLSVPLINGGNSTVEITGQNLDDGNFSARLSTGAIFPGDTASIDIVFRPRELGLQTGTFTLSSNDVAFPQYELRLEGEGLPPFEPGEINLLSRFDIKVDDEIINDVCDIWGYYDDASQREFALVGYGIFTGPPNSGLKVIDVSNPSRPVEVAHLTTVPGWDIKTWQNYAYTVTGTSSGDGSIIDLTNPDDPHVVGSFPSTHNLFISENGYLFREGGSGILIYDLNPDPIHPALVWQSGTQGHDATVIGNIFYSFNGYGGTDFYDISDRASPNLLGAITAPEIAYHHSGWPTQDGRYLYLCDELSAERGRAIDITIWDISDMANPVLVNSISDSTATVHNLFMVDDYVYVSYYNAGFKVFDASDPVNPELIYHYDTEPNLEEPGYSTGAFGVYPFTPSGNVYVSDYNHGLFIFNSLDISTSVSEKSVPQEFLVGDNYPNPFNPTTTISYDLIAAGHVKVSVYNVLGQNIKTLLDKNQSSGSHRLAWDGTNSSGLRVTSGSYYYKIEAGGKSVVKSMLLLK